MKHIIIGKIYRLQVEKDRYNLVKVTDIKPTHIEGYFLEYPSRPIGIAGNEHLLPYLAELYEIRAIKDRPKISQDDINDVLIDLHIYKGKEMLK